MLYCTHFCTLTVIMGFRIMRDVRVFFVVVAIKACQLLDNHTFISMVTPIIMQKKKKQQKKSCSTISHRAY